MHENPAAPRSRSGDPRQPRYRPEACSPYRHTAKGRVGYRFRLARTGEYLERVRIPSATQSRPDAEARRRTRKAARAAGR